MTVCASPVGINCDYAQELAGSVSEESTCDINFLYEQVMHDTNCANDDISLQQESLVSVGTLMQDLKRALSSSSRTSELWLLIEICRPCQTLSVG